MKHKRNIASALFFLASIFLSLGIVDAVTTINTPAASGTVSCGALTTFNVTITDGVVPNRVVNLTFYAQSTLTANSSWVTLATNNSLNLTLLGNQTITGINLTNLLEDANNYIFNVTVINATGTSIVIGADTNTGITVDCTVPVAATSLTPADKAYDDDGSVVFSGTVTGARTTSCTLQFAGISPGNNNGASMTHSGNTCSLTLNNIPEQTYTWFIRASDETNTTDSSSSQVTVSIDTPSGGTVGKALANQGGSALAVIGGEGGLTNTQVIIGILVIVAIVVFIKKYKS